jgi:hypothetical protein
VLGHHDLVHAACAALELLAHALHQRRGGGEAAHQQHALAALAVGQLLQLRPAPAALHLGMAGL